MLPHMQDAEVKSMADAIEALLRPQREGGPRQGRNAPAPAQASRAGGDNAKPVHWQGAQQRPTEQPQPAEADPRSAPGPDRGAEPLSAAVAAPSSTGVTRKYEFRHKGREGPKVTLLLPESSTVGDARRVLSEITGKALPGIKLLGYRQRLFETLDDHVRLPDDSRVPAVVRGLDEPFGGDEHLLTKAQALALQTELHARFAAE